MNRMLWQNALQAHQAGDLAQAAQLYGEILRADPRHFDAHYSLGFLYFQCGQFEAAGQMMLRASLLNAGAADPYFVRGCALQRLNRPADALGCFERAIALRPGFVQALVNRGAVLIALKRHEEALPDLDAALALSPDLAEAWNNRGNALSELGRYDEAVETYDRVLNLRPRLPETLINRGTALLALNRENDAFESYDDALRENPESADGLNGRGNAEFALKDYAAAANDYEAALARRPDYPYARGNLLFSRMHMCDWRGLAEGRAALMADLTLDMAAISPFQAVVLGMGPAQILRSATLWAAEKYPVHAGAAPVPPRLGEGRIRLAYVSADFNLHAVSALTAHVFEAHDRARFETFAFALSPSDGSAMRTRMEAAFDHFIEVPQAADGDIAAFIREHGIDIAVDLMGYTGNCRPGIFAARAAPIQAGWLGFPGTMGAAFMDYIVADRIVIPEEARAQYREAVAYLPDCYLPAARGLGTAAMPTRADADLPENGFVFACFNAGYKITPDMFAIWMRLLAGVEGSVLWLSEGAAAASGRLRKEAALQGVAPERLVFAPFLADAEQHRARLPLADLFLDTRPYGAHSTAADALEAGLPVLTAPGDSFASRVAASQLHALGLPELVAPSLADYEAMALHFARTPEALASIRETLARNRATHPLFDGARFTRNLEAAYDAMWDRARRGEAPGSIG